MLMQPKQEHKVVRFNSKLLMEHLKRAKDKARPTVNRKNLKLRVAQTTSKAKDISYELLNILFYINNARHKQLFIRSPAFVIVTPK